MKTVKLRSDAAGATVIFEFDSDKVQPTEALARCFAGAIFKLLKENPWENAPPVEVALAWSLASVVAHTAKLTEHPDEFIEDVLGTLDNFYNKN